MSDFHIFMYRYVMQNTRQTTVEHHCAICVLQIRHREANLDAIIAPIQDMYTLLTRYEVRLPKDEVDAVSDLRYSWRKLNKQALEVSDNLTKLQVTPCLLT